MDKIDYKQIKKGDVVYLVARDTRWHGDMNAKVISVGKKYITVECGYKFQFLVENGQQKDFNDYDLYPDQVTADIYKEYELKMRRIHLYLDSVLSSDATSDEIDAIYDILDKYKKGKYEI